MWPLSIQKNWKNRHRNKNTKAPDFQTKVRRFCILLQLQKPATNKIANFSNYFRLSEECKSKEPESSHEICHISDGCGCAKKKSPMRIKSNSLFCYAAWEHAAKTRRGMLILRCAVGQQLRMVRIYRKIKPGKWKALFFSYHIREGVKTKKKEKQF